MNGSLTITDLEDMKRKTTAHDAQADLVKAALAYFWHFQERGGVVARRPGQPTEEWLAQRDLLLAAKQFCQNPTA